MEMTVFDHSMEGKSISLAVHLAGFCEPQPFHKTFLEPLLDFGCEMSDKSGANFGHFPQTCNSVFGESSLVLDNSDGVELGLIAKSTQQYFLGLRRINEDALPQRCADGTAKDAVELSGYVAWSCHLHHDARPCEGLFQPWRYDVDTDRSGTYDGAAIWDTVDYPPLRADVSVSSRGWDSTAV